MRYLALLPLFWTFLVEHMHETMPLVPPGLVEDIPRHAVSKTLGRSAHYSCMGEAQKHIEHIQK